MQAVLDSGEVVRGIGDVVFVLNRLGVPDSLIQLIDDMLNEADRLERQEIERIQSDIRSYEGTIEDYTFAMNDILEVVRGFRGCERLNRGKVLSAFSEIEKIIENVH